jgi:hypothetical protein
MVPRDFWKSLSLILLSSTIVGCSFIGSREPEKEVVTVTQTIKQEIATVETPKPLSMNPVYFYVVTEGNFEEFKQRFIDENGVFVFYAITVPSYENLALNMADIKRYLLQQKEIIIYYEKAVSGEPEEKPPEKPVEPQ